MKHFTLPPDHKARPARPAITDVMTPARYLTLRRERAGLSKAAVAGLIAHTHRIDASFARGLLDQLETRGIRARHRETITALEAIFPLDPDVYFQLAHDTADRHPFVCHGCGCSNFDPCSGVDGVCTCASAHACTRCIGTAADLGIAA